VELRLELNEDSISTAVNKFIQFKVDRLAKRNRYDNETRDAVQRYLSSNAKGTFLWVALVCKELADVSGWKAEEKSAAFPPGLDALYELMMGQIRKSSDAKLCKNILAIISAVRRPITLDELVAFVDMPPRSSGNYEALAEIIGLCGSFLTLRERTISFIHQSAKEFFFKEPAGEIFPSGIEDIHHTIFSRSLRVMFTTLQRDVYDLGAPGFPIDRVKRPNLDPLAAARYSCVYWVDHLCDWDSTKSAKHRDDIQDEGAVDRFLRQKYLYWLEALSLLRSMSEGVLSMDKLEGLLQVSLQSILRSRKRSNITLGKGRGIAIDRASSRCLPIYSILQVGNREHSSPGLYISTSIQSGPQRDERIIQAGRARMDYNQAGHAR
jgi:hypothetical protein